MVAELAVAVRPPLTRGQRRAVQAKRPRQAEKIPEYLEPAEIATLLDVARFSDRWRDGNRRAMFMLIQWRAGLRRSEVLALERQDLFLQGDRPTLKVRRGKGNKPRIVPVHPELRQALLAWSWGQDGRETRLITASESTAWRWVRAAYQEAVAQKKIAAGRKVATHTLRHSAARYWLSCGVPINAVSRWLGHLNLATTLVYLKILPDPEGYMDRVP
jgi:integrase